MTLRDASGNILNKGEFEALVQQQPQPEATYRLTAPVYETYSLSGEGESNFESGRRQKFKVGTVLKRSQIDALFQSATAAPALSPASGPAVGGTTVTITGTNLGGVEGVTFGGTPATEVKVKSQSKVTCKAPAHAAGVVAVVIADDSGNVTKATGYTYNA